MPLILAADKPLNVSKIVRPRNVDLGRIYQDEDTPTDLVFISFTPTHTFIFHEADAQAIACAVLAITQPHEDTKNAH